MSRYLLALLVLFAAVRAVAQPTTITSERGRYSVTFPIAPEKKVNPPKIEDGEDWGFAPGTKVTYTVEMYVANHEGRLFMAAYTIYEGEDVRINAERELQMNRDNFLKGITAKLTSSTETKYKLANGTELPGLEFTGESDVWATWGQFFVQGNEVYGVVYVSRKGQDKESDRAVFFKSLKIEKSRLGAEVEK